MILKKRQFTLLELLMVITIIAILAAILLPTLYRARYKARSVVCLNDKRMLFSNMMGHAKDSNGTVDSGENVIINNPWDYDDPLWQRLTFEGTRPEYLICSLADNWDTMPESDMHGYWNTPAPMRNYSGNQENYKTGVGVWTFRGRRGMWPDESKIGETRIDPRISKWTYQDKLINDVYTKTNTILGSVHNKNGVLSELPTAFGDGHAELIQEENLSTDWSMNNNQSEWFYW